MKITLIDAETWQALQNKYPGAYQMLLHNSLVNERENLEHELLDSGILDCRKTWILSRLDELQYI